MERLHLSCQDFIYKISFIGYQHFAAHTGSVAVRLFAVDVAAGEAQKSVICSVFLRHFVLKSAAIAVINLFFKIKQNFTCVNYFRY